MNGIIIPYRNFPIETLRPIAEAWKKESHGDEFGIEIDIDAHLADLSRLANSPNTELFVLLKGVPVGYIGIEFWTNSLGHELMAKEKYWYVIPDARGRDSLRLLKKAAQYAKEMGAVGMLFTASALASDMHDQVCRVYEAMRMRKLETVYMHSLSEDKGDSNGVL